MTTALEDEEGAAPEQPLRIESGFILLGEGDADRRFFQKLVSARGIKPELAVPFIGSARQFNGNTAFSEMLAALQGTMAAFTRVKGIMIVADSGSDPGKTFRLVRRQVHDAGFPTPDKLDEAAFDEGRPAILVSLLPDAETAGALESLYAQEIINRHEWIADCVESYLHCDQIEAHAWPIEKRDKARYECMVAALNKEDPSRAVSVALRNPPVVDIMSPIFDDIAARLGAFCSQVLAH